jgi:surface protein
MSNAIASPDVYHQATTGQYGIVKLLTGQLSDLGVNFFSIKSGEKNSSFKADLGGKYDQTFTWNLDKGDSILGPFYNIRDVVGVLDCYPLKSKSSIKKNPFYLAENGVTVILKDNFPAGSSGKVDGDNSGKIYTAVDEAQLRALNVNTFDYTSVCTTLVTDMSSLFRDANTFNQAINTWDVSNVTNMRSMFREARSFDQPLSNWNVGNVTDMNQMFRSAKVANPDVYYWNVGSVTSMVLLFFDTDLANPNVSNWDVSQVTDMNRMFYVATSFNQAINTWNVSNVIDMSEMFRGANLFNQPLNTWNVANATNMNDMFRDSNLSTENLTAIYENWPQLTLQQNVTFSAGTIKYNSSATEGRDIWINTYNGVLTDGGLV